MPPAKGSTNYENIIVKGKRIEIKIGIYVSLYKI